jgi:polar amino acid transport system substrate-binding protein
MGSPWSGRIVLAISCLAITLGGATPAWAALPVLVLNDTNEPPYTTPERDGFLDVIAGEAFRRAGATLKLVKLPPERGLINANDGIEDGDITRIAGLEKQYPNLVRVPEKLIDWEFSAFSKNTTIQAIWPALQRHSLGHIKGWKIYERAVEGAPHVSTVEDADQLMRLLSLGRIEVALYERWLGLALLKKQGIGDVRPLMPLLATREMYIYLHKRHERLVPKLAEALRALKQDGTYQKVYNHKLKPFHGSAVP